MQVREFRQSPFCWQDKPTLRLINNNVDRKQLSSIRNVYLTLTELASDYSSENINVFIFDVANRSWLSENTVSKCLDILKNLNIIDYEEQVRTSDWRYEKKWIRLVNANLTEHNFEKTSNKLWKNFGGQSLGYIEDNKNNIEDNIEINFISSKEDINTALPVDIKKENKNKEIAEDIQKIFNFWNAQKQTDRHWIGVRKIDDNLTKILTKILKTYPKEEIEIWLSNYKKDIKLRKSWTSYSEHRFTIQKFFTQSNWFVEYYNKNF